MTDLLLPRCHLDHYMQVLNCKQHCAVELASHTSKDEPFKDFLPSHFNYLQFSYYNSEFIEQSISSTRCSWRLRVTGVKWRVYPSCYKVKAGWHPGQVAASTGTY